MWIDVSLKKTSKRSVSTWSVGRCKSESQRETTSHVLGWLLSKRQSKEWWGRGEIGTLLHCSGECIMVEPLWKTVWQFLKKLSVEFTIWSSDFSLRYIPPIVKTRIQRDTYTTILITLFTISKAGNIPSVHQQMNEWTKCAVPYTNTHDGIFNHNREWSSDIHAEDMGWV